MKHGNAYTEDSRPRPVAGETLVETLVAVLISTLAMLMLASAITASVSIVQSTKASMRSYTESEADLATVASSDGTAVPEGSMKIQVLNDDKYKNPDVVSVKYMAKLGLPGFLRDVEIISYKKKVG